MITFEEIETRIKSGDEWGVFDVDADFFGGITRISNGVRLAIMDGGEKINCNPWQVQTLDNSFFDGVTAGRLAEIKECAQEFANANYGTFYERGEKPTPGKEWGEYETTFGRVWLHREGVVTVCFLPFER